MNLFDGVVAGLAVLLVIVGLWKGAIRILVGILALATAWFVAVRFHATAAERTLPASWDPSLARLGMWLAIFFGILLAGGLIAWLLRAVVKAALLGWADRLAGGALGFSAAALATALLVFPLAAYLPGGAGVLETSRLAPYAATVADLVRAASPSDVEERYERGIARLRETWRERSVETRR